MKLGRLTKSIKKEATKSPKKIAFLGIMFLVAIYFWAPLLTKWFGGDGTKGPVTEGTEIASANSQKDQLEVKTSILKKKTNTQATQQPEINWEKWKEWMDQDQFMKSAKLPDEFRNPFQKRTQDGLAQSKDGTKTGSAQRTSFDFAALGLKLDSTLVGRRSSVAIINGKSYQERTKIKTQPGQAPSGLILEQVHPQHVILSYNGKRYQLQMERITLSAGDEIFVKRSEKDFN